MYTEPFEKSFVDSPGDVDAPLPGWIAEVLDGDEPFETPADGRSVLARFVRDIDGADADPVDRRRILRAGLLAAAGRLDGGDD